ncbi:MAG: hypothetical protein WCF17_22065 [Terracidiphilus sp.]
MAEYKSSFSDPDEAPVAWLALAATQLKTGRLESEVLQKAIQVIDSGSDLLRGQEGTKEYSKRKIALQKLRDEITSPQSPQRKTARRIPCDCPWSVGELFAYRLLSGDLIIFQMIDTITDKGGTYPVCVPLNWTGPEIPPTRELEITAIKPSRSDSERKISSMTLVGLTSKWRKRILYLNISQSPLYKRNIRSIPGTRATFE